MPSSHEPPRLAVAPEGAAPWVAQAIRSGGGQVVDLAEAQALLWVAPHQADELAVLLERAPHLQWVQLTWAGVEEFAHLVNGERKWTCGKGVYSEPVAELALSLMLAGLRNLGPYARAGCWTDPFGRNLLGARVTILGGGGICQSLLRLLAPFECHVTVVRNRVMEMQGADVVIESDRYLDALPGADVVVLALALTEDTEGLIARGEMESMERHAWLINVARGKHVVTEDLVWALQQGVIGGAALDVTDPEPLPREHPLWSLHNCIITPHVGNTPEMGDPLLAERITTNVRRWAHGETLVGPVDPALGY
jgi:phosphoglycerate dehydrogenase-like enzyme